MKTFLLLSLLTVSSVIGAPVIWKPGVLPAKTVTLSQGTNPPTVIRLTSGPVTNSLEGVYEVAFDRMPKNWMIVAPKSAAPIDAAALLQINTNATLATFDTNGVARTRKFTKP